LTTNPEAPQATLSRDALSYLNLLLERDPRNMSVDELRAGVEQHAASRLQNSRHRAILDLVEGGRVLDVGCEIGVLAKAIAPRAASVLAIDMRPEAIAIARRFFAARNLEYRTCDFSQLDPGELSFDCVIFLETIEHVEDPVATLGRIRRLLCPGGTLVLSTPNALSYHEVLRQIARLWPSFRTDRGIRRLAAQIAAETPGSGTQEDHLYSWTWETLSRLAHRTGFRYVDHRRVTFGAPSLPVGSRRVWPFGRRELTFLRPLVGPFCQTLLLKLETVK
jgi:2-polyprenyl-3-methyl-5-hydroxy-6-metoxy-1,4-benzoquinol methylase